MQVTIHTAKTNLSKLIEAARAGEEVVIAKGKTPVARIVAIPQGRFEIGLWKGKVTGGPDFFERLSEDDRPAAIRMARGDPIHRQIHPAVRACRRPPYRSPFIAQQARRLDGEVAGSLGATKKSFRVHSRGSAGGRWREMRARDQRPVDSEGPIVSDDEALGNQGE